MSDELDQVESPLAWLDLGDVRGTAACRRLVIHEDRFPAGAVCPRGPAGKHEKRSGSTGAFLCFFSVPLLRRSAERWSAASAQRPVVV